MAKIVRKLARLFGSTAGPTEIGEFGSLAAGIPTFTTNPDTIQSLSNFQAGWYAAVIGGNSPAIQDLNALDFLWSYQIAYLLQEGVPEWNTSTIYFIGSIAQDGSGVIYMSKTDNNQGNVLSNTSNWKKLGGNVTTALGDLVYGGTNGGDAAVLPGNITTTQKVLSQTGTGAASAAPAWVPYVTGVPTGSVTMFAGNTIPSGFLLCDGSAVSRTTYSDLFAAIGTANGAGDFSTTFNIPDLRGKFPRGVDHGAGNDPDAGSRTKPHVGSFSITGDVHSGTNVIDNISGSDWANLSIGMTVQNGAISGITAIITGKPTSSSITYDSTGSSSVSGASIIVSNGAVGDNVGSVQASEFALHHHAVWSGNISGTAAPLTNPSAASICGLTTNSTYVDTAPSGSSTLIQDTGGAETRPINVYLNFIIKT